MNQNNSNTVAPMGMIQGEVNIGEVSGSSRVKRSDVQLLPHGVNLGVLYGFVDLGSHLEAFPGQAPKMSRKVKILFEHPQLKQLFYEEDTVRRSTVSSKECTFTTNNEKAFLKKVIDSIIMRVTSVEEAGKYNPAHLIGKHIGVNIVHTPKKSDPTIFYEKVESVMSANGLALPHPFEPENKPMYFFIDKAGLNFTSQNFADLPGYFRTKIMDSAEGKAHIAKGGKFAENPKQENGQQMQQGNYQQPQQPQQYQQPQGQVHGQIPLQQLAELMAPSAITMTPAAQYTQQQYYDSGWKDAQLVQQGFAVWNAPAQPPAPQQPSAPLGPPQMDVQQPQQFQQVQTPQQPQQYQQVQQPVGPSAPSSFLDNSAENDDLPF